MTVENLNAFARGWGFWAGMAYRSRREAYNEGRADGMRCVVRCAWLTIGSGVRKAVKDSFRKGWQDSRGGVRRG